MKVQQRISQLISWIMHGEGILPTCICGNCNERNDMVIGEVKKCIEVGDIVKIPQGDPMCGFMWEVTKIKLHFVTVTLKFSNGIKVVKEYPDFLLSPA